MGESEAFRSELARSVLALIMVVGTLVLYAAFSFITVPQAARDIIMIIIGALGSNLSQVISFYFGSSKGSVGKDKVLQDVAERCAYDRPARRRVMEDESKG